METNESKTYWVHKIIIKNIINLLIEIQIL